MTKNEFLKELREGLEGLIPASTMADHMRYYENYFREQQAAGRFEEEIAEELGSPRLIAKSIIEASGGEQGIYDTGDFYGEQEESYGSAKVYTMDSKKLKIGCVLAAILALIISMLLFKVIMAFLGPILVIVLVIYLIKQIVNH